MESIWCDIKYANILKSSLNYAKERSDSKFRLNFRCPYCGDSAKNKYKARAWVYENKGSLHFHCFNCGTSAGFSRFLEKMNPSLYEDYVFEKFKRNVSPAPVLIKTEKPKFDIKPHFVLKNLECVNNFDDKHPALVYLNNRQIPASLFSDIFYTETFFNWVAKDAIPGKFTDTQLAKIKDEPRIVFPLRRKDRTIFGFQGRVIGPSKAPKYITFRHEDCDDAKIFGLERLNPEKETFVVEGPIDSFFLPNCIAMVGADANLNTIVNKEFTTIIFDNEPRSKEIVSRINKYISQGWKVCLWPNTFKFKDINEAILGGLTAEKVREIVVSNSHAGLNAELQMKFWSNL